MLFIIEAVGLGFFLKYSKFNKWINTAVAILLLVLAIALGLKFPVYVSLGTWHIIIFAYILVASVAPVWALLQPRDYLNSYLLIFMIVGAVIGVANPSCNLKAFTSFNVDGQYMFPILFVTIACGAVSGFHSLVSSGTASKQIKNEKNMLPVSFGAMLMESMLAIIALIAVASFADGEAAAQGLTTQPQIFAGAIANFLSVIGLPHSLVFTLINLAVSAFALTSLDSVARVGRLSFQEFFLDSDTDEENMSPFLKVVTNKYFATIITLVLAYLLTKVGYAEIWPLFGSANQLLSVLALVACAVFLKKTKRQGCMLWIPMVFMMAVTFTALGMTISKLTKALFTTGLDLGNTLQLIFAVLLLILGVLVAIQGVKKLFEKNDEKQTA
jgi:carbon starvation protein